MIKLEYATGGVAAYYRQEGNEGVFFPERKDLTVKLFGSKIEEINGDGSRFTREVILGKHVLTINESVNKLSVEAENFYADLEIRINGNVGGYKTWINAPALSMVIEGNVDGLGPFLYNRGKFKKIDIKGDVMSNGCPFMGMQEGELIIRGKTPNWDIHKKDNRTATVFNPVALKLMYRRNVETDHLPKTCDYDKDTLWPTPNYDVHVSIDGRKVVQNGWYRKPSGEIVLDQETIMDF